MQQAYRALRIIAEAQTIRIVLAPEPDELMLKELSITCESLHTESSSGIKAVVLDFNPTATQLIRHGPLVTTDHVPTIMKSACAMVRAISQPVLAVVRATPSQPALSLIQVADFTLVADQAMLTISNRETGEENTLAGTQAARLGFVTWSTSANEISKHMEQKAPLPCARRKPAFVWLKQTRQHVWKRYSKSTHSILLNLCKLMTRTRAYKPS